MRSPNRVRVRVQKMDLYSPPSVASGGRMQYAPTIGYVWPFEKLSRFHPFRGRGVGRIQYAPTIGYVRPFKIPMPFPNRVLMALQKTVLFSSPTGSRGGAYSIRPYNWVCAILRNIDANPQSGTCALSKYRCNFPTGYVRFFEIPMRSLDRRHRGVWEVGRWGLPFAGEVGVNEFGEEEDDDQDDDDEGA